MMELALTNGMGCCCDGYGMGITLLPPISHHFTYDATRNDPFLGSDSSMGSVIMPMIGCVLTLPALLTTHYFCLNKVRLTFFVTYLAALAKAITANINMMPMICTVACFCV